MECPGCGAENPENNIFCGNCGTRLHAETIHDQQVVLNDQASQIQPVSGVAPPQYQAYVPSYPARPAKDRSIALILEILPGLFGFLGFGWIYAGNIGAGIAWLIGFLVYVGISVILGILTVGISAICTLPINIALIAISAISLNRYTKSNVELFGP